jgi:hypothetical protein
MRERKESEEEPKQIVISASENRKAEMTPA